VSDAPISYPASGLQGYTLSCGGPLMSRTRDCSQNWAFGAFELEGRTVELRRNGVAIRLQEQPSQLLLFLLQHAGQIVTREELRLQLWPTDTFVDFDHALNTAVMKLREALGDSSEKPLYIQTLPRRGYRFVAPVAVVPSSNGHSSLAATLAPSQRMTASPTTNANPRDLAIADPAIANSHGAATPLENATSTLPELPRAMRQNTPRRAVSFAVASASLLLLAVGGLLVYKLYKAMTSKPAAVVARSLTRITFDEGLQSGPTWSPDGRYIAYSSDRGGKFDIWVQQVSGGNPVQVTKAPGHNWQPDWSPDGKYIAYRSEQGEGGIYFTPALGGVGLERKIAPFGYYPRWSPDSSQVLIQTNFAFTGSNRFYLAQLDASPPREVLTQFLAKDQLVAISAAWHPDGKRVTVSMQSGPSPQFWTIPLQGGLAVYTELAPQIQQEFSELAAQSGGEWAIDSKFSWAPSGRALYLERTFRGARSLWRLNIEPGTLRATSVDQLTSGGGLDTGPAISPDGKKLAFTAASGKVSAWLYPFDANHGRITGAASSVTSPGMDAWLTSVTRDGSELAFSGVRAGETRLWVKSLPDGRELPLSVDHSYRNNPQWSPDGRRLAYFRARNEEQGQIMIWSAESRQEEPLTSPVKAGWDREQLVYDWSPDGRSLLVTKLMLPGSNSIWQIPVAGAPRAESQERKIISDPAYDVFQAHTSPDGRWIVFEAVVHQHTVADPSSLYVMRASGGPWLPIINKNWADKPRWSPDGKTIYFMWSRGGFFDVWGIRFDPETGRPVGDPFPVTTLHSPSLMIPEYMGAVEMSVSRKNLVLTLGQLSGGIWILDNVDH
jgi:Tol biopolymer transport system component/DNA-binding winged helix-turn-helix (wHTH) protein